MRVLSCVVVAAAAGSAAGFVICPLQSKQTSSLCMSAVEENDSPQVAWASEIAEEGKKTLFAKKFLEDSEIKPNPSLPDKNLGPLNYDGLIDGDTFDGGDGQTGVVGDGTNNMPTFSTMEVQKKSKVKGATLVTESKARQRNAWGSNSGYAEELEKAGLKKIDEYGEDRMKVRRQQFENYRNQQELQKQQRSVIMAEEAILGSTGTSANLSWRKGSGRSYLEDLQNKGVEEDESDWKKFKAPVVSSKAEGVVWKEIKELAPNQKITGTIECVSERGRPGSTTCRVKNTCMTFEPFQCSWAGPHDGFDVEPKTGTLNRRNGEAFPLEVSFKTTTPGDARSAFLVVQTEEDKFVFQINGRAG